MLTVRNPIEKSGLPWPPQFYTGQAGCFCCAAPPPQSVYYGSYYRRTITSETCSYCTGTGGQLAQRWMLEVSGIVDKTANPAPCASSPIEPGCGRNNGTFILSPEFFTATCCARASPAFTTTMQFNFGACGLCATVTTAKWHLRFCSTGVARVVLACCPSGGSVFTEFGAIYDLDRTLFDCMGPNTFTKNGTDFFNAGSGGIQICCEGAPATITVTPI